MRIKDMITQDECSWYFSNFSPVLLQDMIICSLKLVVKGLIYVPAVHMSYEPFVTNG